jgi:hypothetical protein
VTSRVVGADEHLQLPEPDPGVHRLLAGAGDLPGPQPVRSSRQWSRYLPAGTRHPIEWDNVVLYGQYILDPEARPPAPSLHEGRP